MKPAYFFCDCNAPLKAFTDVETIVETDAYLIRLKLSTHQSYYTSDRWSSCGKFTCQDKPRLAKHYTAAENADKEIARLLEQNIISTEHDATVMHYTITTRTSLEPVA